MNTLFLLAAVSALAIASQAPTALPTRAPPPLSVLVYKWTRANRSQASSGDQEKKTKDTALDQQIALANRDAEDSGKASAEAQSLGERKQNQLVLIPLPEGVVKGYLYEVQVRNVADKTIKRLQWSYVFTDMLTQKEIVRHQFYSRTQIRPGREKKLTAFTRGTPPAVINVKDLSRNGNQSWRESVVVDGVEFVDGTTWSPEKKDQVVPVRTEH